MPVVRNVWFDADCRSFTTLERTLLLLRLICVSHNLVIDTGIMVAGNYASATDKAFIFGYEYLGSPLA